MEKFKIILNAKDLGIHFLFYELRELNMKNYMKDLNEFLLNFKRQLIPTEFSLINAKEESYPYSFYNYMSFELLF